MFNPEEHMLNLKGKNYLQVMWRLVWFREDKPLWAIETDPVELGDTRAVFKAVIRDEAGAIKSSGTGSETPKDFADFIEKAETKAVGRALAMLGYGTQFAPELDEENRIVDSPVTPRPANKTNPPDISPDDPVGITHILAINEAIKHIGWDAQAFLKSVNKNFNTTYTAISQLTVAQSTAMLKAMAKKEGK